MNESRSPVFQSAILKRDEELLVSAAHCSQSIAESSVKLADRRCHLLLVHHELYECEQALHGALSDRLAEAGTPRD